MRPTNIITKLSIIAMLAGCDGAPTNPEFSTEVSAARTVVYTVTMNGTAVEGGYWGDIGGFWIGAYEVKSNRAQLTTVLQYGQHWYDPTSWLCTPESWTWCEDESDPSTCVTDSWEYCRHTRGGYRSLWAEGLPASALSWKGTVEATVNATLDGAAGTYEECTWDETGAWNCTSGAPTGTVNVTFTKNGQASSTQSGGGTSTYGKWSLRQRGTWRSASADFAGTVNGSAVAGQGNINTGNNVVIERFPAVTP